MGYFTQAFETMPEEARESFFKTVFLNDPSEYAQTVRNAYYKSVLGSMGEGVVIGPGVRIVNPQLVHLEDGVKLYEGVTLIARPGSEIRIGKKTRLKERVLLDTEGADGYIHIANDVYIGTGTTLFGHKGLEIGDHVLMAQNITLTPYSHVFDDPEANIITQGGHSRKVTIGRDAYIGMGVTIMYTGDIGAGSVVAAGAVVVKPIPPYCVAVGCPAKVIKKREKIPVID